ncbi:hypothetical protein [Actinomadura coerulea]|uniref:hypothetical protein n=1 Tax=Actinomadura coerulea TaxID=46159 RepID=UPI00343BBC21
MIVVVVLVLAGVAVLGAVVVLAMGRGGGLAEAHPDYPPVSVDAEGRPVIGWEGSHLRFPRTLWGYQPHVTDDAFHRLTEALHERDARVADLERQLHDVRERARDAEPAGPVGALHGIEEPGARVPLRKESFEADAEESR